MSKYVFKVRGGMHRDKETKKTYKKGDVFTSDCELDKKFKNKFIRLSTTAEGKVIEVNEIQLSEEEKKRVIISKTEIEEQPIDEVPEKDIENEDEEEQPKKKLRRIKKSDKAENDKDVTKDFTMPKGLNDVKVIDIGGGWFNVVDNDGTVYNPKGLRDKSVAKFLKQLATELNS